MFTYLRDRLLSASAPRVQSCAALLYRSTGAWDLHVHKQRVHVNRLACGGRSRLGGQSLQSHTCRSNSAVHFWSECSSLCSYLCVLPCFRARPQPLWGSASRCTRPSTFANSTKSVCCTWGWACKGPAWGLPALSGTKAWSLSRVTRVREVNRTRGTSPMELPIRDRRCTSVQVRVYSESANVTEV